MQFEETFTVTHKPILLDYWAKESTASACGAAPLCETFAPWDACHPETFGITRSHKAVFLWDHRIAEDAQIHRGAALVGRPRRNLQCRSKPNSTGRT